MIEKSKKDRLEKDRLEFHTNTNQNESLGNAVSIIQAFIFVLFL